MRWLWRTSRVRLAWLWFQNRGCLSLCGEQHTYGRGCLLKSGASTVRPGTLIDFEPMLGRGVPTRRLKGKLRPVVEETDETAW